MFLPSPRRTASRLASVSVVGAPPVALACLPLAWQRSLLAATLPMLIALSLAGQPGAAYAQPAPPLAGQASTPNNPAASRSVRAPVKPLWQELTAPQRQALEPLASQWETLSEPHKRKWIVLAGNFQKLAPAEQAKLHSRMTEWIALSPQQRAQARLNFGETQQLSADEKKAKWEAYQALPDEERRKLAASAVRKPPTTAAAVRPVPPEKLASVPRSTASADTKPPRILGPAAPAPAPTSTPTAPATPAAPSTPDSAAESR